MSLSERKEKNFIKRVQKRFPQYKLVKDIDNADLALIFCYNNLNKFNVVNVNPSFKEYLKNHNDKKTTVFYLKHKNDRNRRQIIHNDLDKNRFMAQK